MNDLESMSVVELLQTADHVVDELMRRKVVRTRNKPIGDYTEWLVCNQLGLQIQHNSKAGYDAIDADGTKYQIKGRQCDKTKVQFSVIRNLDQCDFDVAIAVAYNKDFSMRFAAKIPHHLISELATYRKHVNGHVLILGEDSFENEAIESIGDDLAG